MLVIANPANTNCLIVSEAAPSIPRYNFTCLTRLDHDRLIGMITNEFNSHSSQRLTHQINPSHVKDVIIFGNHSTTQVPYVDQASILLDNHWQPVRSLLDSTWIDEVLPGLIQHRGAEIIHHLEASSAMSAARSIIRHLRDWIGPISHHNTEELLPIFSMGVFSEGSAYDVPDGIVFSFPCRRVKSSHLHRHDAHSHSHHRGNVHPSKDYEIIDTYQLNDQQKHALGLSIDELLMEKSMAIHNVNDTLTGKIAQELSI